MKKYFPLLCIALLAACKKDPVEEKPQTVQQTGFTPGQGVFITDEGNFGFGNAKVSYYNFSNGAVTTDLFQPKNGRPLGDVGQSMSVINGKGYVVVNNSAKVEVVNMSDFSSVATITGFNSPRYMLQLSASKAYVTDLYANAINVVDLNTNHITSQIPCPGWTEQLVQSGGIVYAAGHANGKVYVINSLIDAVVDSIPVAKGASSLQFDHNNKLWVLCGGETATGMQGGLYRINASTHTVESSWNFAATDAPVRLNMNATQDTLYYLNSNVYKMWIGASALPPVFIPSAGRNYYSFGINPQNQQLFIADAIDYAQAGRVYIYSRQGVELSHFTAGTIPGSFFFY